MSAVGVSVVPQSANEPSTVMVDGPKKANMVFGEDERILSSRSMNKQNNPNKKIIFR